jgi:hypothetical protein
MRARLQWQGRRGLALALVAAGALAAAPASAASRRHPRKAPPPAAEPAPAPEPAPAAEPAAGATFAPGSALECVRPDQAQAGSDIEIVCAPSSILGVSHMQIGYRGGRSDSFTRVGMQTTDVGFRAVIPGAAAQGNGVQYFTEAFDKANALVATDGRDDSPNVILLRGGTVVAGNDATPLEASAQAAPSEARFAPRAHSLWVGIAFGAAYGWQPSVSLERRSDLNADAGFAGGGLGYLAPEVGFRLTPRLGLSLRGRHQYLPSEGHDPAHPGTSAHWAHSVLARASYAFPFERTAVFVAGQVGGGEGVRFWFPAGQGGSDMTASDTSKAGPVIFGPATGFLFRINQQVALLAELQIFMAAPKFATFADADLGVQMSF